MEKQNFFYKYKCKNTKNNLKQEVKIRFLRIICHTIFENRLLFNYQWKWAILLVIISLLVTSLSKLLVIESSNVT